MIKRVGIVTHYYSSLNYGGVLQAYALVRVVDNISLCYAEQISLVTFHKSKSCNLLQHKEKTKKSKKYYISILVHLSYKLATKSIHFIKSIFFKSQVAKINNLKASNFNHFKYNLIAHSSVVYNIDNINNAGELYDLYITGSDQVWNPCAYSPAYLLDFVPSNKIKISYAASISRESLTEDEEEVFRKSLSDYKAVSVRETKAAELIKDLSPVEPQVVLDPTLLLEREDWDKVSVPRVIEEDYLFCYFLGNNKRERRLALKFAKERNLKVVSVPLTGAKIYSDLKYGDIVLPAATPEEFISLIKYARYVFTDSFHAVVFSRIYERQYFVFNRDKKKSMNSRIYDITKLFHTQERFCDTKEKESLDYINSLYDIDYSVLNKDFDDMKEKSIQFLKTNLAV